MSRKKRAEVVPEDAAVNDDALSEELVPDWENAPDDAAENEAPEVPARKVLRLRSGEVFEVLAEEGKYYLCDGARFRRGNPNIESVTEGR